MINRSPTHENHFSVSADEEMEKGQAVTGNAPAKGSSRQVPADGEGFSVPVFHAAFPVKFFLAEYQYRRGTGHGWPVQPDAAGMPPEGGPQPGKTPAILLRKIHRNKCMENGEQPNRQNTPTGASSFTTKQLEIPMGPAEYLLPYHKNNVTINFT